MHETRLQLHSCAESRRFCVCVLRPFVESCWASCTTSVGATGNHYQPVLLFGTSRCRRLDPMLRPAAGQRVSVRANQGSSARVADMVPTSGTRKKSSRHGSRDTKELVAPPIY